MARLATQNLYFAGSQIEHRQPTCYSDRPDVFNRCLNDTAPTLVRSPRTKSAAAYIDQHLCTTDLIPP